MLPKTITKKELSVLLDISQKRIEELVKEDVLTKNRAGSFDISNITDFVNYERAKMPEEITLSDLAKLFGLTERRVQQLAEDEIAERISRGKYKFVPSIKNYIESMKSAYGEIEDEDGNKIVPTAENIKAIALYDGELFSLIFVALADKIGTASIETLTQKGMGGKDEKGNFEKGTAGAGAESVKSGTLKTAKGLRAATKFLGTKGRPSGSAFSGDAV